MTTIDTKAADFRRFLAANGIQPGLRSDKYDFDRQNGIARISLPEGKIMSVEGYAMRNLRAGGDDPIRVAVAENAEQADIELRRNG